MFTGIVEAQGIVAGFEGKDGSIRLRLRLPPEIAGLAPGQSLAVDGVCLTIVTADGETVEVDLSTETVRRTTLGGLRAGAPVNLERPLPAAGRLGGHFVQGHVDGVGTVARVVPEGDGRRMEIRLPPHLARFVVEKGSMAVDGVSLTVTEAGEQTFGVALIPYTLAATTLGQKRPGDPVNIEVDILAKYVERLLGAQGRVLQEERR